MFTVAGGIVCPRFDAPTDSTAVSYALHTFILFISLRLRYFRIVFPIDESFKFREEKYC